jgi:hypothetical protein
MAGEFRCASPYGQPQEFNTSVNASQTNNAILRPNCVVADPFSDPEGEFLAAVAVSPVYALYGVTGITNVSMPALEHPIGDTVAYHVRRGGHDVTIYDWKQYLNFADRQLKHTAMRSR